MTRKDYIALAEALRIERDSLSLGLRGAILDTAIESFDRAVETTMTALKRDNMNFDKGRFISAVCVHEDRPWTGRQA